MARKTYTITVILKAFFTDCRAQAKIFISEDIQTVLDLENKISRIFGIKDFHLLSNENLLPSCEDIRLLDKADIVSVLPNDSHTNLLLPKRFYSTIDEPIRCKKKKRQYLDDECPIKGKKCKKEKKEATLFDDEKFDDLTQCKANKKFEDFSNKKNKEIKKCNDTAYINQISQPGQSLSSSAPCSIGKIKDPNLHVEKDKTCSLIDKKLQESVNVEEEKMGGEQCIKVNSEKENNLLSDETSGAVSQITSVANNHTLHNSPRKFKKQQINN
ncbi:hypothetical protein WA026_018605 [Henosepilachna vigintioctopunctata]|uniref:Coilin n=1 Tax=Henosepilachna vigintioctopunctata TaxID=420089 RepID=A0AAW1UA62_9CUCU